MAEEIELEKCNFWNFTDAVTLTLNRVIRHTVVHHSSTCVYIPNFIEIGRTNRRDPPNSRSRETKNRKNFKNLARSNLDIVSLRISGHLPAAIINGRGDTVGKVQFSELHRRRDLDLESGHTAYRHASLIDLYIHTKFH